MFTKVNHSLVSLLQLIFLAGLALVLVGCGATAPVKPVAEEEAVQLVWPAPPDLPRIKFVRSISTVEDVTGKKGMSLRDVLMGEDNTEISALAKPYGVHSDSKGRMYVSDTQLGKLVMFDFEKKEVALWGQTGKGKLSKPVGIYADRNGHVYVTDVIDKRVVIFDYDGKYINSFGGPDVFQSPVGIVLNSALDQLFVLDSKKHQILVFDLEGNLLSTIGQRGGGAGEFNIPTNIAIDSQDRLYISDSMNFRVQVLNADGAPLNSFGQAGDRPGEFSRIKGIGVDSYGHIYTIDSAFNNFQIFDQDGNLLLFVGDAGHAAGQFYLPAGAHVDNNNWIYVADQFNRRIQVFEYLGGPKVGPEILEDNADVGEGENEAQPE